MIGRNLVTNMLFENLFIGVQQWRRVELLPVEDCLSGIDITIDNEVKIVKGSRGLRQASFTLIIEGKKMQRFITVSSQCECEIHDVYPLSKILIEKLEAWSVGHINGNPIKFKSNEPYIYRVIVIK